MKLWQMRKTPPSGTAAGNARRPVAPQAPAQIQFLRKPEGTLLSGEGIEVRRDGRTLLQGVSLAIGRQEIVTLIGPNGAGKTTLVRVLLGLEKPLRGRVLRAASLRVGYVPQRFGVDAAIPITVERFLRLGLPVCGPRVQPVLEEVGAPSVAGRQLCRLSGGELQRVLLARALLRDPGLLILDEPLRGVDHVGEAELYTLIGDLRWKRGLGILLVSHDLHVVMAQSDRIICLNRHICCEGVPENVARHPEYMRLFGAGAAQALGLYRHRHDHCHDLAGEPVPSAPPAEEPQTPAPRPRS